MKYLPYIVIVLIAGCTMIIGSDGATVTTEIGAEDILPIK